MNEGSRMERLNQAMSDWAHQVAQVSPPSFVENALLAEFARVNAIRRRKTRIQRTISALSIAASIPFAIWIASRPASQPVPTALETTAAGIAEQPFVPIPYVTSLGPFERMEIVRMEMPVAALIAAGIPVSAVDPGSRVQADVMVGQDGRARAIRLVAPQLNQF